MVIIVKSGSNRQTIDTIIQRVTELGFAPHPIYGVEKTVIAVIGEKTQEKIHVLESLPGVDRIVPILQPYKLAGREVTPESTVIDLGDDLTIGGEKIIVMAGPCAVESREQFLRVAEYVKAAGAKIMRGGVFKPRTSPHDFQGLREEGISLLCEARQTCGMRIITEIIDPRHVETMYDCTDIFQIGARNMQNFTLLSEVGKCDKPVMVKRGLAATIDDLLKAAEYVIVEGNRNVMLCERGIRTFETQTRNTLDISAVPVLKHISHLPVIVDPSHAAGHSWMVPALSKAAVAAGADGLLIETHYSPADALVDGPQALSEEDFGQLMSELPAFCTAAGRCM
jgi:3-deoxy-7-phosphoheptulonate synthase